MLLSDMTVADLRRAEEGLRDARVHVRRLRHFKLAGQLRDLEVKVLSELALREQERREPVHRQLPLIAPSTYHDDHSRRA